MTCVVAYKTQSGDIWLGADSRAGEESTAMACATPKMGAYDGFSIAFAGSYRLGQMILQAFRPPKHPKNVSVDDYMFTIWVEALKAYMTEYCIVKTSDGVEYTDNSEVLIVYQGEIYAMQMDFSLLKPYSKFMSSGSGSPWAIGVMWALDDSDVYTPEEIVTMAIECACEHSPGCGGPIHVMKHDPESKPKPSPRKPRQKKTALSQAVAGSVAETPDT